MANTYTTTYSLIKSEIGGDNEAWGQRLHDNFDEIDGQLINKYDKDMVQGISSTVVSFTNTGTSTGDILATTGDLFQDVEIGDILAVSGASNSENNASHSVTAKASTNQLSVSTGLVSESAGGTISVSLVLKPGRVDIDDGAIDGTTVGSTTAASGAFTSVSATGQITTTQATGSAPLVVASTTVVANLNADQLDGQDAPSGTLVGHTDTQALTNKTLNSDTNTVHADQWRTSRTITLTGGATGSASIDGSGDIDITTTVSGLVKFKGTINSTSLPAAAPAADKTWIAYGSGAYTNDEAATYSGTGDMIHAVTRSTSSDGQNWGANYTGTGDGHQVMASGLERYNETSIANKYGAAGYGYGDCIAITSNEATSWTQILPTSVGTVTWSHYIEMDNA